MPDLIINKTLTIPRSELQFRSVHSSGPGGQHVNKASTKVVLRWNLQESSALPEPIRRRMLDLWAARVSRDGWLTITSQRHRERGRNLEDCLGRLRGMIRDTLKPVKSRRPTRPTQASCRRRRQDKEKQSQKKERRRSPEWSD